MKVTVRTFPQGKREIEIDGEMTVRDVLEYAGIYADEKSTIYMGEKEVNLDEKVVPGSIITKVDNIKGN